MSLKNLKEFLDLEAEEGSENEEHDYTIKRIAEGEKEESCGENEDPNADLEGLIDDNLKECEKQSNLLRNKFKEDELNNDRKMIKEVIRGNFKVKKRKWEDFQKDNSELDRNGEEIQENNVILGKRKKMIASLLTGENSHDISSNNFNKNKNISNIVNLSKYKRQLENFSQTEEENNNQENTPNEEGTEFTDLIIDYQAQIKKKITEQSSAFKRKLQDRIKENDQILESVIDLNKTQVQSQKNIKSGNPFLSFSSSQFSQNSMLNALKKDKYFSQNSDRFSHKESKDFNSALLKNNQGNNIFPMFHKNNNPLNSDKKNKISAIFNKGDITHKVKMN
jgi:hypothetical protein